MLDAGERHAQDAILWKMANDAPAQIEKALTFALTAVQQPFQQIWQVAEDDGQVTGLLHAMMLPVPPIYAGSFGEPGLILPDSFVAPDAPRGTVEALLYAAENALQEAGAQIKLASYCSESDICYLFPRISSRASSARRSRVRMSPADLVQTKGFGRALCCSR